MRTLCLCLFLALTFMVGCAKGPGISEKSREVVEMKDEFKNEKPSCPDAGHEKVAEILPEKEIIPEPIHEKKEQVPEKVAEEVVKEAAPELQPELTDKGFVKKGKLLIEKQRSTATKLASGQKNIVIAQYKLTEVGENVRIRALQLWAGHKDGKTPLGTLGKSIHKVKAYNGSTYLGEGAISNNGRVFININPFIVKKGVTSTLRITVDVADKGSVTFENFVFGIACAQSNNGECWGKTNSSYAITAEGLESGQKITNINSTGMQQGATEKPYDVSVYKAYLVVGIIYNVTLSLKILY